MTEAQSFDRPKKDELRSWQGAKVEFRKGGKRELDLVAAVKRRLEKRSGPTP
jgi:hypothetical protein